LHYRYQSLKVEFHALEANNPEQYIDNFENFIGRWEDKAQLLGIHSDSAIFEIGIDLIPEHFDAFDREYISDNLASTYLSALQKESLLLRLQQVVAQKQNVKDYNSQLVQLKNDLNQQRSSAASNMSDAEWKAYYETEIRKFRVNFFSHSNTKLPNFVFDLPMDLTSLVETTSEKQSQ
jgi:hypothetical protein